MQPRALTEAWWKKGFQGFSAIAQWRNDRPGSPARYFTIAPGSPAPRNHYKYKNCFVQKYENFFFWTYKNFDQLKRPHYTIKTKSWFDPKNPDLTWKYQVETTFFTKNLICSYGPSAHFGCSGFPYRPKKSHTFVFLVVLFDRVMSI